MSLDYNLIGILGNNRIAKGISTVITTLAASYLCTFGSVPAAHAAQKHNAPKQTLEQLATEDLPVVPLIADSQVPEDDIAPVPLVDPKELKKKKKDKEELSEDGIDTVPPLPPVSGSNKKEEKQNLSGDESLELVPLVAPPIEKHKLRIPGPFSAMEIQPLVINVAGGFYDSKRKLFKGRLDINKNGTLEHDLYIEFGDNPDEFQVWLAEIGTNRVINPTLNKANKDILKGIAGWRGSGTRNFYIIFNYTSDPMSSISDVRGIESIRIPSSVLERKIIGYDKVDDRIACEIRKGCVFVNDIPDSELISIRCQQIKGYFNEARTIIEKDIIRTRDGEVGKRSGPKGLWNKDDYKTYAQHLADEAMKRFKQYDSIVGKRTTQGLLQSVIGKHILYEKEKLIEWIDNYNASDVKLARKRIEMQTRKEEKKPDTYVRKIKEPEHKEVAAVEDPVVEVPAVEIAQIQEEPKRFYETWWFWTIVGAAVTGAAVTGGILGSQGGGSPERPSPILTPGDGHYFGR